MLKVERRTSLYLATVCLGNRLSTSSPVCGRHLRFFIGTYNIYPYKQYTDPFLPIHNDNIESICLMVGSNNYCRACNKFLITVQQYVQYVYEIYSKYYLQLCKKPKNKNKFCDPFIWSPSIFFLWEENLYYLDNIIQFSVINLWDFQMNKFLLYLDWWPSVQGCELLSILVQNWESTAPFPTCR